MKQSPENFNVFRFAGLLAIVILGLAFIIATDSGSGGGYSSDADGLYYYRDADGDGYGDPDDTTRSTSKPQGYVTDKTDCDDTDAAINRGAEEICGDHIDNNCDGRINEGCACTDADGDGYYAESGCGTAVDCNDADPAINPGKTEIGGDGIDNNCDGKIDDGISCTDADGDGYYLESACSARPDCNDSNAAVNPGMMDVCGDDIDNDCDGQIDGGCPLFPDTGQTDCYDNAGAVIACPAEGQPLYGQDACYRINPPFYTKLDDGGNNLPNDAAEWAMVRDNVTGLIWEVKTDDGGVHDRDNRYTWYNVADLFIDRLNADQFGGYSDWRAPTVKELICLADYGTWGPVIDTGYFPNTVKSSYLSFPDPVADSGGFCHVNFLSGQSYGLSTSDTYHARAVRGEPSPASFAHNGDNTVTDNATGLMWTRLSADTTMTWQQAMAWCENLSLAMYTDWRLPTIKELSSIVDHNAGSPTADTAYFPDTALAYYWSSTTNAFFPDDAWLINFSSGENIYGSKSVAHHVRAVRGGR